MKAGPLDMGYARPLEFTLSVVVKTKPSPLDFQFAADTLVSQWPVLNLRMNALVSVERLMFYHQTLTI